MPTCPICNSPSSGPAGVCEECTTSGLGNNLAAQTNSPDTNQFETDLTIPAPPDSGGSPGGHGSGVTQAIGSGDTLNDRYQIVSMLGQGGMGSVYKAIDHELDRTVALKTIRADLVANPAALRRFKQELLLTRQIAHYNVIRIFDISVSEGRRFISMEYIDGEDLSSFLRSKGVLQPNEAAAIIEQICKGLAAAHAEDVVHRDLKPQNILMDKRGRVCITDFGLARSFDDAGHSRTGGVLGTPRYMSPEQCRGEQADRRSDLYAVGLMMYEMLSGVVPFADEGMISLFTRRARDRAPSIDTLVPQCPPYLTRVVMRCLEIDRARRYQTADEILHDLDRAPTSSRSSVPKSDHLEVSDLKPGTMLGRRYRIEAEAGQGGMGKVFRASDLELSRSVALKVIRPELTGDPETLERLRHEVTLASRISHPSVVRTHDLGECDGLRFISMAWLEGETLDHLIHRAGVLDEPTIIRIAEQICGGLQAAHSEGIVHRDLKPGNVMLDAEQRPYLMDFGLAETPRLHCVYSPSTPTQSGMTSGLNSSGTPRYMSPEQVAGEPVDSRSDLYSLGLILYEMGTGVPAFRGDTSFQTMMQRISEPPRYPRLLNPSLSPKLADIIMRLLERQPDQRFATAAEVLEALHQPDISTSDSRRLLKPWQISVLAAVVVAAFVTGYFAFRTGGQNTPYVAVLVHPSGPDQRLVYASEGINEAISSSLFPLKGVHLTSSAGLDPADLKLSEKAIAQKLGVNRVVGGIVEDQGDTLSVIIRIQNPSTGQTIWTSSPFTGSQDKLLDLQTKICGEVVTHLDPQVTPEQKQLASIQPTHNVEAYDLYLKGRSIYKNSATIPEDTEKALALFEKAREKDPTFALASTGVADASLRLYRMKKDPFMVDKALAAAEEAKRQNSQLPEVLFSVGSVLSRTGKSQEAIQQFKKALEIAPNSDDGYLRLGRAYLDAGQKTEGLAAFKKATELNPYYFYNFNQLGKAYFETGNNDKAAEAFLRALAIQSSNPSSHTNLAAVYLRQGRWSDAIPQLQTAIRLKPTLLAYTNLGTAYFYLGHYKDAIDMYETAVKINPNDRLAAGNLADAYRQNGQKEKADTHYTHAVELAYKELQVNPKDTSALGGLSLYLARTGKSAEGLDNIKKARQLNANDSSLMYYEAIILALNKEQVDANIALKRALEHGYSDAQAKAEPDLRQIYAAVRRR